ncbi:MAG TPA: hypothetical protein VN893_14190 [Bryobacteraceae bacterium]|nr:hypothetical protein [Bryobacteraceae bacterium]
MFEEGEDKLLASECRAAIGVIDRVLGCQESGTRALAAVRAVFTKLSTVLRYTGRYGDYQLRMESLQSALEDLCRLVPCQDCNKPAAECSCAPAGGECTCGDGTETGFAHYGQWLEVNRSGSLLKNAVARFKTTLDEVKPHLERYTETEKCHGEIEDAVDRFLVLVQGARAAAGACSPLAVDDVLRALREQAANLTFAYDRLRCHLSQLNCTTQPAFFAMLEADADGIGLLTATLLRSVHQLSVPCSTIGAQLGKVWKEMRAYETGALKQAFRKYEDRLMCPPGQCYDKTTKELHRIIEHGLADSAGIAVDAYGCDEARFLRHRQLVDQAVQEITRLDCRNPEGLERCVWTRLGSFTASLYAILGRSSSIVSEQVRTLAVSVRSLWGWLQNMTPEPPQDALPFLRAGLAILRSLEDRAQGYGFCAQVPTSSCPEYGQMELRIVDDYDQPIPRCRVLIRPQGSDGQIHEFVADDSGFIRKLMPKGPYQVSATGGEFPALTMVVQ